MIGKIGRYPIRDNKKRRIKMLELLKKSLDECPIIDMDGYNYFIHPISNGIPHVDPDLLNEVVNFMMEIGNFNCDYIIAPEAMGIPLAVPISLKLNIPFTIVRKKKCGLPGEVRIIQQTGYSKSDMYINGLKKGDRVTIVDDVLSTGGTMRAMIDALKNIIGCDVVDVVVAFDKSGKREKMEKDLGVNIHALLDIKIVDGRITYSD